MTPAARPSKEEVRVYGEQRRAARTPPPSPEEVRRQLGWHMLPQNGRQAR